MEPKPLGSVYDRMTDSAAPPPPKPRRRRLRRAGLWSLALTLVAVIVLAGGVIYMTGRPITAPPWLEQRITARIAQEMPDARVTFGEMVFILDKDWRPRVRLRDIAVSDLSGAEIISFSEFKATLALTPLLEGKVQPRDIALSGVFATLRRDSKGRVSLTGGAGSAAPVREAATLPQLIGGVGQLLDRPAFSALVGIDLRALTLQYDDARAARGWTLDGGRLILKRDGDDLALSADLAVLSGGANAATLSANYTGRIGVPSAEFGVTFADVVASDIAAQGPAFAWLDVLRASISGSVRSGVLADGTLAPLNATLQIGSGAVQPNDLTQPIPFDGARSYFSFDAQTQVLRFDEFSVRSKWISGQATGEAVLAGITGGKLDNLTAQFNLRDLTANPGDLYPEPVSLTEADVDFQMSLNPFRIRIGRLQISDAGKTLVLDGALQADPAGWRVAIDGQMDGLEPDRLLTLWPERLKPKTRAWMVQNLIAAQAHNIDLALRLAPDTPPQTYLAFDYDDATVRFLKTLPPITKGRGHMSLADNRLVVSLDAGEVIAPQGGGVTLTGSAFIMPDVRVKDGPPGVIRLETQSTLTAALSLLNQPPMMVMDKARLPVTLADGRVSVKGTLAMPLRKGGKPSDVKYHVTGDLRSVSSSTLVKGRTLKAALLSLTADNTNLEIGGQGQIDGIAFDGTWAQPIGKGSDKSALRGTVVLSPQTLDSFGIILTPGTVSGKGNGQIALDFQRGTPPKFDLRSDMGGLRVALPQLSWTKPAGTSGSLQVSGTLGKVPQVEVLRIEGAGLTAQGAVRLGAGGALDRVRFDRLALGDWLDIPVDLVGQGKGRPVGIVIRGGKLDLRRAKFGPSTTKGPPGPPMQVFLDQLQITDTIALRGLRGTFGTAKGLDGSFEATLNGGTSVQGRVLPQNGRSAVRLVSNDAGGVLRSAGLLKQVAGGQLSLTLLPVGSGGAFDGRLAVSAVTIRDAPGIAALLNAVSVVGLVNELNGDGIYFDDVEADFRLTPNRLTLAKASAVGASMGISMDGVYALDSGQIAMQGVITPVYLLNGIGSVLTRKGEGLFGFNYTLSGAAKSPAVSVNPLSALTPGGLRDIFRAPATKLPPVDGNSATTLPPSQPAPDNEPDNESNKEVVRPFVGR